MRRSLALAGGLVAMAVLATVAAGAHSSTSKCTAQDHPSISSQAVKVPVSGSSGQGEVYVDPAGPRAGGHNPGGWITVDGTGYKHNWAGSFEGRSTQAGPGGVCHEEGGNKVIDTR